MESITFQEAAEHYKVTANMDISEKDLVARIYEKPHLGVWKVITGGKRRLVSVKKDTFINFLKCRRKLRGPAEIFSCDEI